MYCEDNEADEIEHLWPKSLYPDRTFRWDNHFFVCGPCNGPKNNHFPVLSAQTGCIVDVSRRRGAPVVPPEPGRMMLLDPRRDDPLRFLVLDLTFLVPVPAATPSGLCRSRSSVEDNPGART